MILRYNVFWGPFITMCLSFLFHLEQFCMWQVVFEFYRWDKLRSKVTNDLLDTKNCRERCHWDWNHGLLVSKPKRLERKPRSPAPGSVRGCSLPWRVLSKAAVVCCCIINIQSGGGRSTEHPAVGLWRSWLLAASLYIRIFCLFWCSNLFSFFSPNE